MDACLELVDQHSEIDRRQVIDLMVRYSGLTKHTQSDRIADAVADEVRDLIDRAAADLADGSAEAVAALRAAADTGAFPGAELERLVAQADSATADRLRGWVDRHGALTERIGWLLSGTSVDHVGRLDPVRDCDRIHHATSSAFRVESRVAELLAILRISQSTALSLFFRSTRESEDNPVHRFHDTYTLFANYFEWGAQSKRGRAAVARINQIHGRYFIPQDGMKYVLLNSAFTWIEAIERIGHRPLLETERHGYFHAYLRLGRDMNITDLTDDYAEMYRWFLDASSANEGFHPLKPDTFETIALNSLDDLVLPGLREALLPAARVGMHPSFRRALGYPEPEPTDREKVRGVFFTLGTLNELLPPGAYVRSLQNNPAHPKGPPEPGHLGVAGRSVHFPVIDPGRDNGGYPEDQLPVRTPAEAVAVDLPVLPWSEIAKHRTESSLWVVIDGEVYDLTGWVRYHPGGRDVLLRCAGRDATAAFGAAEHSAAIATFRLNYRIGVVG